MKIKKVALCVLTRNELPCLKVIFPKMPRPSQEAGFDAIYAIDGGSTDGTVEFFSENNIPVIAQSKRGRGEAFLIAFREIDADAYVFFSPDGNESIDDICKFKPILECGADLVIASRMMKGAVNEEDHQFLRLRKWANNAFNLAVNLLFRRKGQFISDSINGFRAITKSAADRLQLDAWDYTIEYQMTMRALKARMKIVEFPTIEGQRIAGETGAPSFQTGLRFIGRLFKEFFAAPRV
ncbi:MAG: glycosyltransferase family 2 protein [Oligoflexia bacterium]|nr:glycosyltransferase family 2 protein [Oligoflexia bacterium]